MLQNLAHNLASDLGVALTRVSIVNGTRLGCLDVHLLHMSSGRHLSSALIHQSEIDSLHKGEQTGRLETKIRDALTRLKELLDR
jgi:hypothetical protein